MSRKSLYRVLRMIWILLAALLLFAAGCKRVLETAEEEITGNPSDASERESLKEEETSSETEEPAEETPVETGEPAEETSAKAVEPSESKTEGTDTEKQNRTDAPEPLTTAEKEGRNGTSGAPSAPSANEAHVHQWVTEQVLVSPSWEEQVVKKEAWKETFVIIHTEKGDVKVPVAGVGPGTVTLDYEWDQPVSETHVFCKCGLDMTEEMKRTGQSFSEYQHEHSWPSIMNEIDVYNEVYVENPGMSEEELSKKKLERYVERYGKNPCSGWYTASVIRTVHRTTCEFSYYANSDYEFIEHPAEYGIVSHPAEYRTVTRCASCGAVK